MGCSRRRVLLPILLLLLPLALQVSTPVVAQRSSWNTLSGNQPIVVAKGGFSGLFPESSSIAYNYANFLNLPSVTFWCDVQMTKDAVGICLPEVLLDNCTDIQYGNSPLQNKKSTYSVNGRRVTGYFALDFTYEQLFNFTGLTQENLARPPNFDSFYRILKVDDVGELNQSLWLNIQHDLFYKNHGLNITKYVLEITRDVPVSYISSPEVIFLKNIAPTFTSMGTKLVFRFPDDETIEPSTNQTYASLLNNLTFIKTFASGILIPKSYIWPVSPGPDRFLQTHNPIVTDAHDAKLEVFASEFANDQLIAYNYSYNPVTEYLYFIDNGNFSVDGFLSDFPSTAWEAIGCFSHLENNTIQSKTPLVITHYGDSGNFPRSTDLAYMNAIKEGADVIDCFVQVTKDGRLVCLSSIDLVDSTTVVKSKFASLFSTIPEIQSEHGIFSFNLTWEEILNNLKPQITNPLIQQYQILTRNPANQNAGKFMSLDDFLSLAKSSTVTGVLIDLENAHFIVENLQFDIIGSVMNALHDAGFDSQATQKVMIQSTSSSTLIPFKQKTNYTIVYKLAELVGDADKKSVSDIKSFAHAVSVDKRAIFQTSKEFITNLTHIVSTFRSANLDVYAYVLMNEFVNIPWDFFGDAIMEIHNLVVEANVSGVITDFPASSVLYRRNSCSKSNFSIPPAIPGFLVDPRIMSYLPPTQQPLPILTVSNVSEPALPPVISTVPASKPASPPLGSGSSRVPSLLVYLSTLVGVIWFLI